jgi:hypothetical protein
VNRNEGVAAEVAAVRGLITAKGQKPKERNTHF